MPAILRVRQALDHGHIARFQRTSESIAFRYERSKANRKWKKSFCEAHKVQNRYAERYLTAWCSSAGEQLSSHARATLRALMGKWLY